MITPMFIPLIRRRKVEKCPSCGGDEQIIKICKHCRAEYEEQESLTFLQVFGIVACIIWIMITMLTWLFANHDNESLFEILKKQFEWLINLRIF